MPLKQDYKLFNMVKVMEWQNGDYLLTDDSSRIHLDVIVGLLSETYWASDRPKSVIEESIANSICFSLFLKNKQIGFARVVTDRAVFSWIADFVIHPELRRTGLGKWMLECILEHPFVRKTVQVLQTKEAHRFYAKYGFEDHEVMRRKPNDS